MKKLLASILAICLVLSTMGTVVFAEAGMGTTLMNVSNPNDMFISGEFWNINANESIVIKLYDKNDVLLSTTTLLENKYLSRTGLSYKIQITGESDAWGTVWEDGKLNVNYVPKTVKLYVDGKEVASNVINWATTSGEYAITWADIVKSKGDVTYAPYIGVSDDREALKVDVYDAKALNSLVVELYSDNTLISTTTLREFDRDDENVKLYPAIGTRTANIVSWGRLAGSWDTVWNKFNQAYVPNKIVVKADGIVVDVFEGDMSADNIATYMSLQGIGKAQAKIGDKLYETLKDAVADAKSGAEVKILVPGTYSIPTGKNITITGDVDGVIFECGQKNIGMNGANVTFNNVTFNWAANGWPYHGLAHSGNLVYNNCTVNGTVFLYGASDTFNNCIFNVTGDTYNVWTYGSANATFNNCKFYSAGKSMLIYIEGAQDKPKDEAIDFYKSTTVKNVVVENCEFYASQAVEGKAAIEIDTSLYPQTISINNSSDIGFAKGSLSGDTLWNVKKQFAYIDELLAANNGVYNNSLTVNGKNVDLLAYTDEENSNKPVLSVDFVENTDASNLDEGYIVYDINITSESNINRLNSVDLTFDFDTNDKMAYEVIKVDNITVTTDADYEHRYMFNYNGKEDNVVDSGETLTIGQIKVTGYGTYKLAVDADKTNVANATTLANNIVDTYLSKGAVAGQGVLDVTDAETATIKVPTRELTVNVKFPNAVVDNEAAYQNMKVEITGNIDGVNKTVEYKLGDENNAGNNASYTVEEDSLVLNNAYTVTVSGDGYRTARYTVTMTGNKTLNFWNNVMDNEMEVEEGKESSAVVKNFLAGDIVADNNINIYDLSAVVSYFTQSAKTNADYIKYDLNRDGVIDSKDVAYVLVSWGE